jgi:hypothetical protein
MQSFGHLSKAGLFLVVSLIIKQSLQHESMNVTGFLKAKTTYSSGGYAVCIKGQIEVAATTHENQKLLFDSPVDQYAATAAVIEYLQANSTLFSRICGGPATVSGIFKIEAKICFPKNGIVSSDTIQFLIHGIGFTQDYWDFAKGYSYIDVAAKAGYTTFSYDRLGVGGSDHPDPIQIVQALLQVEIAHSMVLSLRHGKFGGRRFKNVIGVGHSFGSIQVIGILARHLQAFDAVVLTGFSSSTDSLATTFADFNSAIASQNQRARFGHLPNGYLVTDSSISNQVSSMLIPTRALAREWTE